MKAHLAREKAQQAVNNGHVQQLLQIHGKIKTAANQGEFSVHHYGGLINSVKRDLEQDGYQVKSFYDRGDLIYTISWSA